MPTTLKSLLNSVLRGMQIYEFIPLIARNGLNMNGHTITPTMQLRNLMRAG